MKEMKHASSKLPQRSVPLCTRHHMAAHALLSMILCVQPPGWPAQKIQPDELHGADALTNCGADGLLQLDLATAAEQADLTARPSMSAVGSKAVSGAQGALLSDRSLGIQDEDLRSVLNDADLDALCQVMPTKVQMIISSESMATIHAPQQAPKRPMLCRVAFANSTKPGPGKLALLEVVDSLDYLFYGQEHKEHYLWWSLINKAAYAKRTGRDLYLWVGGKVPETRKQSCDEKASNHYLKPLASFALLSAQPALHGLLFMDADAWFRPTRKGDEVAQPESYMDMVPKADFVFTGGHQHKIFPILLNGGIYMVKNTHLGRKFLERWFALRCGAKDQGALWQAAFELLRDVPGSKFTFDHSAFKTYKTANKYAFCHFRKNYHAVGHDDHLACRDLTCWYYPWLSEASCRLSNLGLLSQLVKPLQVGPMGIVPEVSRHVNGTFAPAMRHDFYHVHKPTLMCHITHGDSDDNDCSASVDSVCAHNSCSEE